jgi:hypothetical protein
MENNNSLDPLGPEFGRINAPAIDSKSLTPFEGDTLKDNKINFFPVTGPLSSTNPSIAIQDAVTGRAPRIQSKNNPRKGVTASQVGDAFAQNFKMELAANRDRNQYAKVNAYNAGPSGNSFYKRYAAFGQKKFDEIGFSPLRDNEAMYNANTSWSDKFVRSMTYGLIPLTARGFISGPKSLIKMMQGDFSTDLEDARINAEASAIGQDTSKGLGAFFNNTAMSFGYTAGIIAESILEEVAGALLSPLTGGGSFFAATANNARKIGKIGEAIDMAVDGYKAVNQTLKEANNINGARKMWKAAENINASKITKFINPFENTFDAIVGIGKNTDNLTGLARLSQSTSRTAGGLFRDVRNINMALAEARLEGGLVENELYDKAYDAFYLKNKRAPNDDEQYQMTKTAKEAGMHTLMWNTGLILASNKIVIPNLLKSGVSKRALQSKLDDVYSFKGGKVVLEKTFKEGKKIANGTFTYVEDSFKNSLKGFKKAPVMTTAKIAGKYLKGNLMEGVQENLQDVISTSNEEYYLTAYKNKELGAHLYNKSLDSLMYNGVKNQFSAQGFETFSSGLLMGLFSGGLNLLKGGFDYGYNNTFNKEKYQEYKETREKHGKEVAQQLTALYNTPSQFFNSRIFNYGTQNNIITEIDDADTKKAKDELARAFVTQVTTALNTNTLNYFKDHIASFKELTQEEYEEAFGFEKGTGTNQQEKIDSILANVDSVQKAYTYAMDRFKDPIDLSDYKEGTPEYEDADMLKNAWRQGINSYVFKNHAFMNATKRMTDISGSILNNPSMKNMSQLDMNFILDPSNIGNEIDLLNSEIETLKQATDKKSKDDLLKKQKRVTALEDFAAAHKQYESRPSKVKVANAVFEEIKKQNNLEELTNEQKLQILEENKDKLKEVFGEELSDSEIEHILDAEKGETLLNSKLEIAYKNYLKNTNGIDPSYVFDTDIDNSFVTLKHYYELYKESKQLVEQINLLHDPQGFMDHIDKTRVWMSNMYNNRQDYYIDMVNKQMAALESNELLNRLADMNIFIDLDEFQDFMENGTPPKEFFDQTTKQVVPIGSEKYKELFFKLFQAKALREKNVKQETLDEKLQVQIDKLNVAEQIELDALEKVEVKTKGNTVKKDDLTIKDIAVAVALGEYVDITDASNGNVITLYSSEQGLRSNDNDGDLISIKDVTSKFSQFTTYKIEFKSDPEQVKVINEKYNKLKEETIAKYNAEKEKNELKVYSINTPLNQFPKDLYKQLQDAYNESEEAQSVDTLDLEDEDIEIMFSNFILKNPVAKEIIDAYNAKNEEEVQNEKSGAIDEFDFQQGKKTVNTSKYTTDQLTAIVAQLKLLKDAEKEIVKKEIYSTLINKFEKLIATRKGKEFTPEVQEMIKTLEEKLLAQQKNIEKINEDNYKVKSTGVLLERVTNFLKKLKKGLFKYKGVATIAKAFNNSIDRIGLNKESIDDFVNELDDTLFKLKKSGYTKDTVDGINSTSDILRTYLNNILENKENQPVKSKKALLLDIQKFIADNVYVYTQVAGTYLDEQLRNFFTPGSVPKFDESKITREAYDELFGADSFIRPLKKKIDSGELYVLANNIKVFDEETGVAGEIDLLLIDKEGKLQIIDFKTGDQEKWNGFVNKTESGLNKLDEYTLQQYTYARLLKKMTGLDAEINIMPIEVTINQKEYRIYSVNQPTNTKLLGLDKWYFKLDPNFNDIKSRIDAKIKIEKKDTGKQTPPPASNQSDIEAKKADIERRRQEDLNFNKITKSSTGISAPALWSSLAEIQQKIENDFKGNPSLSISTYIKNNKAVSKYTQEKINEFNLALENVINAKYDAELAALEKSTTETTDPISDEVYDNFIDYGVVPQEIINYIADKIKNKEQLSERETAIATYKTAEINKRLEELYKLEQEKITKVSELTLKKGDTVIVENTIFGKNEGIVFANKGAVITVLKSTEKGVTFTYNKRQKTVPLSELDKHVTTMPIAKAKEAQKADEKLDEIDKDIIAESSKIVKDFIKKDEAMTNAQTKADNKKLADIYNDLLNDLDC